MYENLLSSCSHFIELIEGLKLRKLKPRVLELTDAGPGVGKSNRDVKFRAAEKVMIQELDFYTRIHRATGDCQNEVERTQSAVGKAISDGGSINWEYKSLDIHSEQVHNMNLEQLEVYEDEIYMHNVTETCKELAMRIENSPGPRGGFMVGLVADLKDNMFFNDDKTLKAFLDAARTKKCDLPGYNYYKTISDFYESHFDEGELYLEFVKFRCEEKTGTICKFCNHGWSGQPITSVPRPYPDDNLMYKEYNETPICNETGNLREPDDYQPRCQIRKMFEEGILTSSAAEDEIEKFRKKYAVDDKSLIMAEIHHMETMKLKKEKRSEQRKKKTQVENATNIDQYNWEELHLQGTIKTLSINVLNKFITEKKLCDPIPRKKSEKISLVEAYLARRKAINICRGKTEVKNVEKPHVSSDSEDDDVMSNMSETDLDEELIDEIGSDCEDTLVPPPVGVSRYGRFVSHWKHRKFFGDSDSDDE